MYKMQSLNLSSTYRIVLFINNVIIIYILPFWIFSWLMCISERVDHVHAKFGVCTIVSTSERGRYSKADSEVLLLLSASTFSSYLIFSLVGYIFLLMHDLFSFSHISKIQLRMSNIFKNFQYVIWVALC